MELEEELALRLGATSAVFLGEGTFGSTYRVEGLDAGTQPSAVKILKGAHFDSRLLERETSHLGDFDHNNIVRFRGVREIELLGETSFAIVCEYIDGGNARQAVQNYGLPNHESVRSFGVGLLSAVSELHSKDKVHRDLKPDNIMLRDGDWARPVLIDFGLVRSLTGNTMTVYPALVGSIPWMAPEQLRGEKARKSCDIWASGIVLYQLLTGRHPFLHGVNIRELEPEDLVELVSVPPDPLEEGIPDDLAELVMRLLTPEPANARGSARRALKSLKGGA